MQEKTPRSITPKIDEFCKSISSFAPQFIVVSPIPQSRINDCFNNVKHYVEKVGGKQIFGWAIWQRANILLHAEAHSIWESPKGEMIDITPHQGNDEKILFLRDISIQYQGNIIPSIYKQLTDSFLVKEFIELLNKRNHIMTETSGDTVALPIDMVHRIYELNVTFSIKVGRNELCPCGSGKKYKRCCGLYN